MENHLSDLAQGKQTLLVLYAKEHANERQREQLDQLIGKREFSYNDADVVKSIMINTGALQYTKEQATAFVNQAKKAMESWDRDWDEETKRFFASVLIAAINREY